MYSTAFWCLFVVLLFLWLYCVTTVTPLIERRPGPRQVEVTSLHFVLSKEYSMHFITLTKERKEGKR